LGHTLTPPLGSLSSGSDSNNDSGVEMWYVAPTPMHQQQETIMLELSSSSEDLEEVEEEPNHGEKVCHDQYFIYCYLFPFN
jgi:hypothetical protein